MNGRYFANEDSKKVSSILWTCSVVPRYVSAFCRSIVIFLVRASLPRAFPTLLSCGSFPMDHPEMMQIGASGHSRRFFKEYPSPDRCKRACEVCRSNQHDCESLPGN